MEDIETDLERLAHDAQTVEEFRADLEAEGHGKLPGLFAFVAILKNKQADTTKKYETRSTSRR